MDERVLWEQTGETKDIVLVFDVYKCGQCAHVERGQEGSMSDYARGQIEAHYVREHMPKRKLKIASDRGWRERTLYHVTGHNEFNALLAYVKRGSQYAMESKGKFTKPGWYYDHEETRRDSEGETVIEHRLCHAEEWAARLEAQAADCLGMARDIRALTRSEP